MSALEPLEIILEKNRPYLLRQAQRLCGGPNDAEDLVQDAFLRFMSTFRTAPLPDDRSCAGWLATALRNSFISQLRRREVQERAQRDPSFRDSVVSLPGLPEPPDSEGVFVTVTDEELESAARALSPKQKEVFDASAAGKSYDQIATLLGIRRTAVAKRLHDARQRLRKTMLTNRGSKEQ